MRDRSKPWFAPKRYGYGAGLPITWQGWAVLAVYFAVFIGAASIFPAISNPAIRVPAIAAVLLVATIVLIAICATKTKGGWRWRWGKDS